MNTSFRLLSSIALAAVTASIVNAQAYAFNSTTTSVDTFAINGSYQTSSYISTTIWGPYGYGHVSSYDLAFGHTYQHGSYGAAAYGFARAAPNGEIQEYSQSEYVVNFTNSNDFTVDIGLHVSTYCYSTARATAPGDWAIGEGLSLVYFDAYLLQASISTAAVDDPNDDLGSYIQVYNYNIATGHNFHYIYYGFESPFSDYALADGYNTFRVEVAPYSTGTIRLISFSEQEAQSVRSTSSTPSPAAVVPFAVGLLGAMRRRGRG